MKALWHSIHWRIFGYYSLLIALSLAVMVGAEYYSHKKDLERTQMIDLQNMGIRLLPAALGAPKDRDESGVDRGAGNQSAWMEKAAQNLSREMEIAERKSIFFVAQDAFGNIRTQTRNFPNGLEKNFPPHPFPIGTSPPQAPPESLSIIPSTSYLLISLRTPPGGQLLVGMPRRSLDVMAFIHLIETVLWAVIFFIIFSLIGYWIINLGLRPIGLISETARRIADGELSGRIDVKSQRSELGQLARVLNQTFDRLEDALKRQARFTADASHELRTPVAAILADCQFSLKKERPTQRYLETIEVCHESAQHMRSLIDRLGLLAKFDAHEASMEKEPVDLKDLAEQAIQLVEPLAGEKQVHLVLETPPTLVEGDRLRLGQTVINLLNNAIHYNYGGGSVTIRTGLSGNRAFLEVIDTGIGIPKEKLGRIFDRFYRVDDSRSNKTGGTGLGLAICKTIVEAHGGILSVTSREGQGSCFRMELKALTGP